MLLIIFANAAAAEAPGPGSQEVFQFFSVAPSCSHPFSTNLADLNRCRMIACSGVNLRLLHVVYRVWDTWTVMLLKERGPAAAIASYADGKRNTPGTRGVGGVRGAVRHLTHQLRPLTCALPPAERHPVPRGGPVHVRQLRRGVDQQLRPERSRGRLSGRSAISLSYGLDAGAACCAAPLQAPGSQRTRRSLPRSRPGPLP